MNIHAYIACLLSETNYSSCMHKKAIIVFPTLSSLLFQKVFSGLNESTLHSSVHHDPLQPGLQKVSVKSKKKSTILYSAIKLKSTVLSQCKTRPVKYFTVFHQSKLLHIFFKAAFSGMVFQLHMVVGTNTVEKNQDGIMPCYCNNDSSLMCKIERQHHVKERGDIAAQQTCSDPCLCLSHFCKPPLHLSKFNVFLSVRQSYCHCQSLVGL